MKFIKIMFRGKPRDWDLTNNFYREAGILKICPRAVGGDVTFGKYGRPVIRLVYY